jgi:NifU-like protein
LPFYFPFFLFFFPYPSFSTFCRLPFTFCSLLSNFKIVSFYPGKISDRFLFPKKAGDLTDAIAVGAEVDFTCGVSVRFSLDIEPESKTIIAARFRSNGCGYVISAADFISEKIEGKKLTELHGLEDLESAISFEFGKPPLDREHCVDLCTAALQNALAEYRSRQISQWEGEKALICTCFGAAEETIENLIIEENLRTVEEVGENCNAGTGCGSCQPLIQEVLDSAVLR